MTKKSVYVVRMNTYDDGDLVKEMWKEEDFKLVRTIEEADIIQFLGGEDVSPVLYLKEKHHYAHNNVLRDLAELGVYFKALSLGKQFVGICRGGQFLNVVNGGELWQHVEGHGRSHPLLYKEKEYRVTSTHHQVMRPGVTGELLCVANVGAKVFPVTGDPSVETFEEVEVVYYPNTDSLCFQPHPEYQCKSTRELFFDILEETLGLEK